MSGNRKHRSKEKLKFKILDDDAEAFQSKIESTAKVPDLSDSLKPKRSNVLNLDLTPEAVERSAYDMLVESLGDEKKKPEPTTKRSRSGSQPKEKEKKNKKIKIDEPVEVDENWEQYKADMMKEIELREAQQRALFDDGQDDEDSLDEQEEFEVNFDIQKDYNYLSYSSHFNEPLECDFKPNPYTEISSSPYTVWSSKLTSLPANKAVKDSNIHPEIVQAWTRFVQKELLPASQHANTRNNTNARAPKLLVQSLEALCASELTLTPCQARLYPSIAAYQDVYFAAETHQQYAEIRALYIMHAMSTVLTANDIIQSNNRALKKNKTDAEFRDQGFVKPRVLLLLPTRHHCFQAIAQIVKLMPLVKGRKLVVNNKKKCFAEFFTPTEIDADTRKPVDWIERFQGNNDDSFKLGLTVERNRLDLYRNFYESDIIVASPLGLRLAIDKKEGVVDFLSSIELVIVDQIESFLMQNWDHVRFIFERLNLIPSTFKTDIQRLRMTSIDGKAKNLRQSLVFGCIHHADVNNLFNTFCFNSTGRLKFVPCYGDGAIGAVTQKINQYFQRFSCDSVAAAAASRFKYFTEQLFPSLVEEMERGVLLYIPSYFDFVRVRNFLRQKKKAGVLSFAQCCEYVGVEYTSKSNADRARFYFSQEQRDWMIYTERYHYFFRHTLKGIRKIVFYGLPSFPEFYSEILNSSQNYCTAISLFCPYDVYQLEAIVGHARSTRLMQSEKVTHFFQ